MVGIETYVDQLWRALFARREPGRQVVHICGTLNADARSAEGSGDLKKLRPPEPSTGRIHLFLNELNMLRPIAADVEDNHERVKRRSNSGVKLNQVAGHEPAIAGRLERFRTNLDQEDRKWPERPKAGRVFPIPIAPKTL